MEEMCNRDWMKLRSSNLDYDRENRRRHWDLNPFTPMVVKTPNLITSNTTYNMYVCTGFTYCLELPSYLNPECSNLREKLAPYQLKLLSISYFALEIIEDDSRKQVPGTRHFWLTNEMVIMFHVQCVFVALACH